MWLKGVVMWLKGVVMWLKGVVIKSLLLKGFLTTLGGSERKCTFMNEVTRYNNQLNTVPMRKWSPEEQNFFFAIITQARDKGTTLLEFQKDDLIEFANYSLKYNKRFYETMESLVEKLSTMRYKERTSHSFQIMTLFQRFKIDWSEDLSEMTAQIKISEDFDYIVNKLDAEFTQFELKQFTNIRSSYAKEMFKMLKQWRTVGKKEYSVAEFRELLQVPKSYRATDIKQVVLKPILDELPEYFSNFKIKTIKAKRRGNPIISYEFSWDYEKTSNWESGKFDKKPYRKKSKRVESLPEWAKDKKENKKDEFLSEEQQAVFKERLKRIRETEITKKE